MKEKFMTKILVVFLFFISLTCKSQNCKDINILNIDFKSYKQVILEENEDNVIDGITNISFSPGGKYLLINNYNLGDLKIYNKSVGKIVSDLRPTSELNDYFALYSSPFYNYCGTGENAEILTRARLLEVATQRGHPEYFDINIDEMARAHKYWISFFETDSIIKTIAVFDLRVVVHDGLGGAGLQTFLRINLNGNILDTVFLPFTNDNKILSSPDSRYFVENNGYYYQPTVTQVNDLKENFERIGAIVKIDSKGNIIEFAGKLAKEYCESRIYNDLHDVFIKLNKNNELIYTEQLKLRINNLDKETSFNLKNLTMKNDSGFKYLTKKYKNPYEKKIKWDSLFILFDTGIENLDVLDNGNYMVHLRIYNENPDKDKRVIQEYTPDGCLVKEMRVDNIIGQDKIIYSCYCKEENAIVFAVRDDTNYKLIFSKW